jgi:hypothetical protein
LRRDHDSRHPPQSNTEDEENQTDTISITNATSPTYDNAQQEYRTLSRRLTDLRQSLDTAQQALQIEKDNQNAQVQALIDKWTSIVREAVEELYDIAKEDTNHRSQESNHAQPSFWDDQDSALLTEDQRELQQLEQNEAERYGVLESVEDDAEEVQVSFYWYQPSKNPLIHQIARFDHGNVVETTRYRPRVDRFCHRHPDLVRLIYSQQCLAASRDVCRYLRTAYESVYHLLN